MSEADKSVISTVFMKPGSGGYGKDSVERTRLATDRVM
jgi:hypothetical protein